MDTVQILVRNLLPVGLLVLAGCGQVTPEERMALAESHFESGALIAAAAELKSLLLEAPDHAEARFLLGRTHLRLEDYAGALKEFERAAELGVSAERVRPGLLASKLPLGEVDMVISEVMALGTIDDELELVLADARFAAGEVDKAEILYASVLASSPRNPAAHLGIARIAVQRGDSSRARPHLDAVIASAPELLDAHLEMGEIALRTGDLKLAHDAFEVANDLPSEAGKGPGRLGRARAYILDGKYEKAAEKLEQARWRVRKVPEGHYQQAVLAYLRGDLDASAGALMQAQKLARDYPGGLYLMGAVKLQQGQLEQARANLRRAVALTSAHLDARKLLAAVHVVQDDWTDVVEALEPVAEWTRDPEALAMLGSAYLKLGRWSDATVALQRAVALAPDMTVFSRVVAVRLFSKGSGDPRYPELVVPVQLDRDPYPNAHLLVMLRLRRGDLAGAQAVIQELIDRTPTSPIGHQLRGAVLLRSEGPAGARLAFQRALEIDPGYRPATRALADMACRDGAAAAAAVEKHWLALLKHSPGNAAAHVALAALAVEQNRFEQALEHFHQAVETEAKLHRHATRMTLAQLFLSRDQLPAAVALVEEGLRQAPQHPRLGLLAAQLELQQGAIRVAAQRTRRLDAWAVNRDVDTDWRQALAELQAQVGDRAAALSNYERVLKAADGGHPAALRALVRLHLLGADSAAARQAYERLDELQPEAPAARMLAGELLVAENRPEDAIATFRTLAAEGHELAMTRLGELMAQTGRSQEALPMLTQWLAAHPDHDAVRLRLAHLHQEAGDPAKADIHYQRLLDSQRPEVLRGLARVYFQRNDERAAELAARALALAPADADVAHTYGWILVQAGAPERGLELLAQSALQQRDDPTLLYHLAVAHLKLQDRITARSALKLALSLGPFAEAAAARQTLAAL